jgi:anti-sigma regulatory factor (Ser/Thr protein kinase)
MTHASAVGGRALCVVRDPNLRRTLQRTLHAAGSSVEFVAIEDVAALVGDARAPDLVFLDAEARRALDPAQWPDAAVVVIGESLEDEGTVELLRWTAEHQISDAEVDEAEVVATSVKVLTGDLFGIEKYLGWGARIEHREVDGYDAKRTALDDVSEFARECGARRSLITRIESVVDELLMNALYDAPDLGRTGAPATLRFGTDGRLIAVSVEDRYGRLERNDIVDHVTRARREKGRPREPTDEAAGAGLGLYFIVAQATRIIANVEEGRRTEMICLFDLRQSGSEATGARSIHFFGRSRLARGTKEP